MRIENPWCVGLHSSYLLYSTVYGSSRSTCPRGRRLLPAIQLIPGASTRIARAPKV